MKKVLWAALVVVLAISAFVFTGCGEHEGSDAFTVYRRAYVREQNFGRGR